MDVKTLLSYLPKEHGEHGVDSALHMLCKKQEAIHEVFCNPPGGAWIQFNIINPVDLEFYSYSQIPRVSDSKRPDLVFQYNTGNEINFIVIESKQRKSDIKTVMPITLRKFLIDSQSGIRNRPAWHKRINEQSIWQFIGNIENKSRYWFKNYDISLIKVWSCFAYACSPEYYRDISQIPSKDISQQLEQILKEMQDLQIAICIGWYGHYHYPFAIVKYKEEFIKSETRLYFNKLLKPIFL